jgi:hypothetical protein
MVGIHYAYTVVLMEESVVTRGLQLFGRRGIVKVFLNVMALATSGLPVGASVEQGSNPSVQIAWNPSPGTNLVGYNLYYGGQSRTYTNHLALGNVTNASFSGAPGAIYFFVVTARDSAGDESVPSNETTCIFPNLSAAENAAVHPVVLQISGISNGVTITASPLASAWVLEASEDLRNWQPMASGSNSTVNSTVISGGRPALFFRLRGP